MQFVSHPLVRTLGQRLALGLLTLFLVSMLIFLAVELLPGDFARSILGQSATPETVAAFQREIGLDRPFVTRYVDWISGALVGDFGSSFSSREGYSRTVADIVGPRLLNTFILAGATAAIAVPLALGLGILSALYRNSLFDKVVSILTLITISLPDFFIAYILMLYMAIKFRWFSSLSNVNPDMGFFDMLPLLVLPVMTLTLVIVAHMMRMTRASIIGLLASAYIEMAHLKGLSPLRVILRHALPNAWAPIAVVVAFNLAYLVVGVVVVEVVFVYPGIGQVMVDAVRTRDIPVVQACALIFAATYILLNLVADIVSIVTNPKLLHPR
ncbi:ABC transporter permease [Shinella sp. S4-D37]|uniref:ABC transporter permease n=1 Tax=Shinella sp. S4-D37 TaxID=3161999 RepID=UPI0034659239